VATKECLWPPDLEEAMEDYAWAWQGSRALPTPWLWTCRLQTWEIRNYCSFKPPTVWLSVTTATGN
jgi:hypothetical protein